MRWCRHPEGEGGGRRRALKGKERESSVLKYQRVRKQLWLWEQSPSESWVRARSQGMQGLRHWVSSLNKDPWALKYDSETLKPPNWMRPQAPKCGLSANVWVRCLYTFAQLGTIFQGVELPQWPINNLPTEQDWEFRVRFTLIKGKKAEEYNIPSSAGLYGKSRTWHV